MAADMKPAGTGDPIHILLVEDNPGDIRLVQEALKDAKLLNPLHVVADGERALMFVRREGEYSDAPRPDLILLDLRLPGLSGLEVLERLKSDPKFCRIPVVVLTTSDADRDVTQAYNLSANCFVTKPVDFEQFTKVVQQIEMFWFAIVKLPPDQ
jgi:two-component system, chemotaxis family, response regulator Rcp1